MYELFVSTWLVAVPPQHRLQFSTIVLVVSLLKNLRGGLHANVWTKHEARRQVQGDDQIRRVGVGRSRGPELRQLEHSART